MISPTPEHVPNSISKKTLPSQRVMDSKQHTRRAAQKGLDKMNNFDKAKRLYAEKGGFTHKVTKGAVDAKFPKLSFPSIKPK